MEINYISEKTPLIDEVYETTLGDANAMLWVMVDSMGMDIDEMNESNERQVRKAVDSFIELDGGDSGIERLRVVARILNMSISLAAMAILDIKEKLDLQKLREELE